MWKTVESSIPRDGEPLTPSNLAPGRAIKLRGMSAVKVDKVTTEWTQIHSGHSVGICPLRKNQE